MNKRALCYTGVLKVTSDSCVYLEVNLHFAQSESALSLNLFQIHMKRLPKKKLLVYILEVFLRSISTPLMPGLLVAISFNS